MSPLTWACDMETVAMTSPAVVVSRSGLRQIRQGLISRSTVVLGAIMISFGAACKDSNVPYFTAPTSVPTTPDGIQNAIAGLFGFSRNDVGGYVTTMSGFSCDIVAMAAGNPQILSQENGVTPIPGGVRRDLGQRISRRWRSARHRSGAPAIRLRRTHQPELAAITGVVQTMEAVNLMLVGRNPRHAGDPHPREWGNSRTCVLQQRRVGVYRRPLGIGEPEPEYGRQHRDPGQTSSGFRRGQRIGRAEYCYRDRSHCSIARWPERRDWNWRTRWPATARRPTPTPTSAGSPDVPALTRADSAIAASALYSPGTPALPKPGPFADPLGVYWDFSPQSGDQVNPINQFITWYTVLNTFVADVDTVNDMRWKGKFGPNPYTLELPAYSLFVSGDLFVFYPGGKRADSKSCATKASCLSGRRFNWAWATWQKQSR